MGTSGPAPKRSDQRRRRNAPERPIEQPTGAASDAPALLLDGVHPLAAALYEALRDSPEAQYYTPAVWQRARISTLVLSNALSAGGKMSAIMYSAIQSDWKDLLISPADQRRLGIEVQRADTGPDPEDERVVSQIDEYRRRLAESS